MAKRRKGTKKKKEETPGEAWSRRQFNLALVNTGITLVATGTSAYFASKPTPPVQVIVQGPPQPVQVARAITMPLEASAYLTVTLEDAVLTHGTVSVQPGPTSS
jgi:hypothetical protein